ncbi:Adenosylhomocysteinase [Microbacterium sp. 8M]|nr:Adenosylhomocysteinase [Microbacterium sp. 8M]
MEQPGAHRRARSAHGHGRRRGCDGTRVGPGARRRHRRLALVLRERPEPVRVPRRGRAHLVDDDPRRMSGLSADRGARATTA